MEFPGSPRARAVSGDLPAAEELGSHLEPAVAGTRPGLVQVNYADPGVGEKNEGLAPTSHGPGEKRRSGPSFPRPPGYILSLPPEWCCFREVVGVWPPILLSRLAPSSCER